LPEKKLSFAQNNGFARVGGGEAAAPWLVHLW